MGTGGTHSWSGAFFVSLARRDHSRRHGREGEWAGSDGVQVNVSLFPAFSKELINIHGRKR